MHYFEDAEEATAVINFLADKDWEKSLYDLKRDQLWIISEFLDLKLTTEIRKGQLLWEVVRAVRVYKETINAGNEANIEGKEQDKVKEQPDNVTGRDELVDERFVDVRIQVLREQARIKELELKAIEMQAHEREKERDHEIQVLKLQIQLTTGNCNNNNNNCSNFNVMSALKLVPIFEESDVSDFFAAFERIAKKLEWPTDMWTTLVQCRLKGKAQRVYNTLKDDLSSDYDTVKAIVLRAYDLVPEAYRQKFRNFRKTSEITFVEFSRRKENYFDDWVKSKEVDDFDNLRELMLVEEFKNSVPRDLKTHLEELKLDTVQEIAIAADEYALTHRVEVKSNSVVKSSSNNNNVWIRDNKAYDNGSTSPDKFNDTATRSGNNSGSGGSSRGRSFANSGRPRSDNSSNVSGPRSNIVCFWCNRKGHIKANCNAMKNYLAKQTQEPIAMVTAEEAPPISREEEI